MLLFRVRVYRENPLVEPLIAPSPKLRLLAKLGDNMVLPKCFLYDDDTRDSALTIQAQKVLDTVAMMKSRPRSAKLSLDMFLRYAPATNLPDMCAELRAMNADVRSKRAQPTCLEACTMPISLKLTSDGGCQLTEEEKTVIARQLRKTRGATNIPLLEGQVLVQMIGSVISSYPSAEMTSRTSRQLSTLLRTWWPNVPSLPHRPVPGAYRSFCC